MTPENIGSHLAKIRKNREEWVKNRPNDLKLVETLQKKFFDNLRKDPNHTNRDN